MDQIKRIPDNKWTKKYYVHPVFLKSRTENQSIKYLKNQNYINSNSYYALKLSEYKKR